MSPRGNGLQMDHDSHDDLDMGCFNIESISEEVEAIDDDTDVKSLMRKMLVLIKKQDHELKTLKQGKSWMREEIINNTNSFQQLDERVVELEKYSRKLCLIFSNVEDRGDPVNSILNLFSSLFQLDFNPARFAACHPLNQSPGAPIIVKFLYHADREFIWRRKSWLRGMRNSFGKPVMVEECLAPRDRVLKSEAKQLGLLSYTRKQDVYAFNQNMPDSNAIKVTSVAELSSFAAIKNQPQQSFLPKPAENVAKSHLMFETPHQMPPLTRKPSTVAPQSAKRKRLQLSPVVENDDVPESLVNSLVTNLVPALLDALKDKLGSDANRSVSDKNIIDAESNNTQQENTFHSSANVEVT